MAEARRDIYGNAIDWAPTGRRDVDHHGHMRAEMKKGVTVVWMYCRPHEECAVCAIPNSHTGCPVQVRGEGDP